jgi:hypothetical protein
LSGGPVMGQKGVIVLEAGDGHDLKGHGVSSFAW